MRQLPMHLLLPAALVASLAAPAAPAAPGASTPPAAPVLEGAAAGTVLFDDDGGRVQVVPAGPERPQDATFHGGPVLAHARVRALFLGSSWREHRALEAKAVAALEAAARAAGDRADATGVSVHEDLNDPPSGRKVGDLEVQRRLERTWGSAREGDAVTVLFLAPDLLSTLGAESVSGRDFLAYHNHFHATAGVIVYAVVPYSASESSWLGSARRAFREALANPEGNAWY